MAQVFIVADSLKPSNHLREQAYSYGGGPVYPTPVLIDPAGDGQQATLLTASNTRAVFSYQTAIYKLLNRQQAFKTVLAKSTDSGASWAILDSAGSPPFENCSGYFDAATAQVYCAYQAGNGTPADVNLIIFDLVTEKWGVPFGVAGAPTAAPGGTNSQFAVWKRPGNTLLVIYSNRGDFTLTTSGIGASVYDLAGNAWGAAFDVGAALLALAGWDNTRTLAVMGRFTSAMDSTGRVHCFFNTTSTVISPTWANRCFYQAIELDNSLGSFLDFPGQTAPFPPAPYNFQQLTAFSGSPMGEPCIVGDSIVLPVLMRNDSVIDRFPVELPNVYVGTPLSAPVWSLDTGGTIDPGALIDDTIWAQQAPAAFFDGSSIYAVWSAQDPDGQNMARLRLASTPNIVSPATGWNAVTIFDLQLDAPPGFNFATQVIVVASVFVPVAVAPPFPFRSGAAKGPRFCPAVKIAPRLDLVSMQDAYEAERPANVPEVCVPTVSTLRDRMIKH